MGAKIDRSMNDGHGPPVFKISGQVHHRIGSLLPQEGLPPKFIQLYVYDTANEVTNRIRALDPNEPSGTNIEPATVQALISMLDDHNPFAKEFRNARDRLQEHGDQEFAIRIVAPAQSDPPTYSLPATEQLALLVVDDFTVDACQRDIVVQSDPSSCKHMMEFRLSTCPYQISSFVSATNNLTYSSSLTKNFMDQTLLLISCHQFQNMKPSTYRG